MEDQKGLIELDKRHLELKERESMLAWQLKELNTQQGQIGLKIINAQQEMERLERKIEDVKKERENAYARLYETKAETARRGKAKGAKK